MDHKTIRGDGMSGPASKEENDAMLAVLRRVRRHMRGLLVVEAVCRLVAWVIFIAGVLALLDWWVRFPWFVRILFLAVGVVFACYRGYRTIWRPMTAPIHLEQLALGLSSLPMGLKDRIAGSIAYLQGTGEGSPELWRQVVFEATQFVEGLPGRGVLQTRPAARSLASAMGALLGVAIAAWFVPQYVAVGAMRLARPLAKKEWPKSTRIAPLTTDAVVAWGEAFTAQMRLDAGDRPSARAYLSWIAPPQPPQREQMRRDVDGVYRFTLENIRKPMRYSFSAGDDDTAGRPFQIKVVRRPAVASIHLTVTPPVYAKQLPTMSRVMDDTPVVVLTGSAAKFDVSPDRPIGREGASRAALLLDGDRRVPLISMASDVNSLTGAFEVEKNTSMEVFLIDADGLESRGGLTYRIQAKPDEPPTVAVARPSGVTEATPTAIVELQSTAQDDVGLEAYSLLATKDRSEFRAIADLLAVVQVEKSPGDHRGAPASSPHVPPLRCDVIYAWNLETLGVVPGDVIRYYVEARDGYESQSRRHDPVHTPVMTINVISPAQLGDRLKLDLMAARGPLRDLLTQLLSTLDRTGHLDAKPAGPEPLDAKDRQSMEELAGRLQRLRSGSQQTAEKIEEIVQKAARNGAATAESARQADRLARRLKGTVSDRLQDAAQSLARAQEAKQANARHEQLKDSEAAQKEIAASLQSMLDEVERWSDFEELVRKLRELLDRQEALEREATQLARNAGRDAGEPDREVSATKAARASAGQSQLRADTVALVQSMREWAGQRHETDSAASLSVESAASMAEEKSLTAMMDEASRSISDGLFGKAAEQQRNAAAVFRSMLAALEKKPDRELADLSRALQEVTARLRKLIQAEEALIRDTRTAAGLPDSSERLQMLSGRQATLRKTTLALAAKLKESDEEGLAAKRAVVGASSQMGKASDLLDSVQAADAQIAQADAIVGLQKGLELLEHLEAKTEQAIAERSLAQIVAMLSELRRAQAELRGETAEIQGRSSEERRWSRADSLKAAKLAKEQRGLGTPLEAVREKMKSSVVYDYVCEKIAGRLEKAAKRLDEKDCRAALVEQDSILRDLSSLLEAAAEQPRKDEKRFVEDSGGGGAGRPTPEKPVPTLAELKVLRRMQADLGDRTAELNRSLPAPLQRTEAQLKDVQSLGRSQQDLHDLAVKMVEKAAGQKDE